MPRVSHQVILELLKNLLLAPGVIHLFEYILFHFKKITLDPKCTICEFHVDKERFGDSDCGNLM